MTERKPESVVIPATVDQMKSRLGAWNHLMHAKGWERAAIVAGFVRLSTQGRGTPKTVTVKGKVVSYLSVAEFAALDIAGLRSQATIRGLVKKWLSLGVGYPVPGLAIELPDKPWEERTLIEQHDKDKADAEWAEYVERLKTGKAPAAPTLAVVDTKTVVKAQGPVGIPDKAQPNEAALNRAAGIWGDTPKSLRESRFVEHMENEAVAVAQMDLSTIDRRHMVELAIGVWQRQLRAIEQSEREAKVIA